MQRPLYATAVAKKVFILRLGMRTAVCVGVNDEGNASKTVCTV